MFYPNLKLFEICIVFIPWDLQTQYDFIIDNRPCVFENVQFVVKKILNTSDNLGVVKLKSSLVTYGTCVFIIIVFFVFDLKFFNIFVVFVANCFSKPFFSFLDVSIYLVISQLFHFILHLSHNRFPTNQIRNVNNLLL